MKETNQKIKIMLIDSDSFEAQRLKEQLTNQSVLELTGVVQDGNEALNKIIELQPDVIIIDLLLPNVDGISLLEDLNGLNLTKEPFIIITSSITFLDTIEYSFQLGADYYIMKPYCMEYVVRRIMQIVINNKKVKRVKSESSIVSEKMHEEYAIINAVTDVLIELGVPTNVKGYQYIRDSIVLAIHDMSMLHYITKLIYPSIAAKYDATPSSVERAIRNAIEICFTRTGGDVLYHTFGNAIDVNKGKVTNSEFIGLIADKLRLQYQIHR